jgi:hypothetical protein
MDAWIEIGHDDADDTSRFRPTEVMSEEPVRRAEESDDITFATRDSIASLTAGVHETARVVRDRARETFPSELLHDDDGDGAGRNLEGMIIPQLVPAPHTIGKDEVEAFLRRVVVLGRVVRTRERMARIATELDQYARTMTTCAQRATKYYTALPLQVKQFARQAQIALRQHILYQITRVRKATESVQRARSLLGSSGGPIPSSQGRGLTLEALVREGPQGFGASVRDAASALNAKRKDLSNLLAQLTRDLNTIRESEGTVLGVIVGTLREQIAAFEAAAEAGEVRREAECVLLSFQEFLKEVGEGVKDEGPQRPPEELLAKIADEDVRERLASMPPTVAREQINELRKSIEGLGESERNDEDMRERVRILVDILAYRVRGLDSRSRASSRQYVARVWSLRAGKLEAIIQEISAGASQVEEALHAQVRPIRDAEDRIQGVASQFITGTVESTRSTSSKIVESWKMATLRVHQDAVVQLAGIVDSARDATVACASAIAMALRDSGVDVPMTALDDRSDFGGDGDQDILRAASGKASVDDGLLQKPSRVRVGDDGAAFGDGLAAGNDDADDDDAGNDDGTTIATLGRARQVVLGTMVAFCRRVTFMLRNHLALLSAEHRSAALAVAKDENVLRRLLTDVSSMTGKKRHRR